MRREFYQKDLIRNAAASGRGGVLPGRRCGGRSVRMQLRTAGISAKCTACFLREIKSLSRILRIKSLKMGKYFAIICLSVRTAVFDQPGPCNSAGCCANQALFIHTKAEKRSSTQGSAFRERTAGESPRRKLGKSPRSRRPKTYGPSLAGTLRYRGNPCWWV